MTYLLDSHAFVWSIIDPSKLSSKARLTIEDNEQSILVSVVSFWELSLKYALGKLHLQGVLPEEFPALAKKNRY